MSEIMPGWYNYANCQDTDPEAFFYNENTTPADIETAKRVCQRCRVAEYCLKYALQEGIQHGIWGGMTAKERQQLRKKVNKSPEK